VCLRHNLIYYWMKSHKEKQMYNYGYDTLTLGDRKNFIHIQRWNDDILCIALILSYSPFFICSFSSRLVHLLIFNKTFRSVWSINYCIPNPFVYRFNENLHSYFPKLIVYAIKHRWPMNRGTFSKKGVYFHPFQKIFNQTWISFKNLALDTNY